MLDDGRELRLDGEGYERDDQEESGETVAQARVEGESGGGDTGDGREGAQGGWGGAAREGWAVGYFRVVAWVIGRGGGTSAAAVIG